MVRVTLALYLVLIALLIAGYAWNSIWTAKRRRELRRREIEALEYNRKIQELRDAWTKERGRLGL